jgi:flavin reductase (DIM6/NTAB) family NADH-FMN oxidoreductase RutF
MSGSLEPPLCVVSVTKRAHMHDHLIAAGRFVVNILAAGQENLATHFSGRPIPGLDAPFAPVAGLYALPMASAWITAEVVAEHDCGDHTIFIGHIRFMAADEQAPLVYHAGRYASLVPMRDAANPVPEFW